MKAYLLFAGRNCYPYGGILDLRGDFDSENEAKEAILRKNAVAEWSDEFWHWWHIVNSGSLELVSYGLSGELKHYGLQGKNSILDLEKESFGEFRM